MLALLVAATLAQTNAPDLRSTLLDAMQQELARNKQALKLKGNAGPYFISYQVKDFDQQEVGARYGALFNDFDLHDRKVFADVRVGDYRFDSSNEDPFEFSTSLKGTSYIARKEAPLDDSPLALRTALWLVTDEKYKSALFNYLKKKGEDVYAVEDPKRPPAFSKEKPAKFVGPRLPFAFDRPKWSKLARELSGQLAAQKDLFDSEVRVTADKVVRLFVNSEGTRLVTEETIYGVHVQAYTRADDGQLLENSRDWYAPTEAGLPDEAVIRAEVKDLTAELTALRTAPTIDPYTGPAVLEADAAGVLFHEAVGHRLEGERQDNDIEGKTFRGQVGRRVLPAFISIVDDPTAKERGGKALNGHYRFDDQGVPAQRAELVKDGVLKGYILSRKPVEGFLSSNGHGRAQGNRKPVARMANLIIESSKKVKDAELKTMLIAEAKKQGKPFGLIIRDIVGGNTNTSNFGYQAFKSVPRMVYRVDVETGKETLVRGVELVGTPLTSINKVLASGDTEGVFNGYCGAESGMVPVSTVSPAVLLQEIELQRTMDGKDRPPLLDSPAVTKHR